MGLVLPKPTPHGSQVHDKPRCYNGKCSKCQLFGHRLPECRQLNQFIDAKNAEEDYDNEIATFEAL
jgi:hypothetical protein